MRNKKILFVGSSSFTGYHFVKTIIKKTNFEIYCTFTKNFNNYKSIRKKRILDIYKNNKVKSFFKVKFGDKKFLKILSQNKFEIICFHHALTKNYNDDKNFNFNKLLDKNLFNIEKVFKFINRNSIIIVSNTIFQKIKKKYEPLNKYGLSKTITYEKIKELCKKKKIKLKSIFISNPWGILEAKKLNYNMIKNWLLNKKVTISYPNYIRDNIYIDKLSNEYIKIIKSKNNKSEYYPSGYCSSNEAYINSLKYEFEKFFKIKARTLFKYDNFHNQPIVRINGKSYKKKIKIKENLKPYFNYYKKIFKKI